MTPNQIRNILMALAGYWSTPVLTEEEIIVWTAEINRLPMSYTEIMRVIRAESGRQWRPRPGELIDLVQHYRRQDALRRPRPALSDGRRLSAQENLAGVARCRELLTSPGTNR